MRVCLCVCVCAQSGGELLTSSGLRSDGRRWSELRSVRVSCGVASGVDGSCSYQQGGTLVLATVQGPWEHASGAGGGVGGGGGEAAAGDSACRVLVHTKVAPFAGSVRREQRRSDARLLELSAVIRQSVSGVLLTSLLPASSHIAVGLTVLRDDGGLLPAALNAATLALLHAGIPMRDVPVAVSVACTASGGPGSASQQAGTVLLDPTVSEVSAVSAQSGCALQLGVGCISERIVLMISSGRLPATELGGLLSASQAACHAIHQRMKDEMSRCSRTSDSAQHTADSTRASVPLAAD